MPFSLLPRDIVVSILLRLPASSLARLRYACKLWWEIISDDSFIYTHLSLSPTTIMLPYEPKIEMLDEIRPPDLRIGYIDIDGSNNACFRHLFFRLERLRIWASCNGLILMTSYLDNRQVEIANPATNQVAKLSPPINGRQERPILFQYQVFGLGFVPSTKEYKVVCMEFRRRWWLQDGESRCQIMTLGSNTWRLLDHNIPVDEQVQWLCNDLQRPGKSPISVGGGLFWPIFEDGILAMNLSNERFCWIPIPDYNIGDYFIFELGGRLSWMAYISFGHYNIWVRERLEGSWVKLHSIGPHVAVNVHIHNLEPVGSLRNGELIVFQFESEAYAYDMRTQELFKIKIAGKRGKLVYLNRCLAHVNSLVSW